MNKLRVTNSNLYVIEVNDNGDTIEFDYTDPMLAIRAMECYDNLEKMAKEIEDEEKKISSRKDDKELNPFITQNQKDLLMLNAEYYEKARGVMDLFLGEGACLKIFGDRNWGTMYDDLFEMLDPHLTKMGVNFQNLQKKAASKYKAKTNKKAI
jgi:hypothetical protein